MSDSSANKTANLASCFQEVITAVLRVRSQRQAVQNSESFRTQFRQLLQTAMSDARTLGYNSQYIQMAVLVTVGFLDETVLNLGTSVVADWARGPLQEELFGGHVAGETVFTNLRGLLQQQDSPELADVLEIHCICLELGYKGRYAFGNTGELRQIIQLCRDKILRVRGKRPLFAMPDVASPAQRAGKDGLSLALLVCAIVLLVAVLGAFAAYQYSLSNGVTTLVNTAAEVR